MPRKYKKQLGSDGKRNYNLDYLRTAVEKVKLGRMSIREASATYAVPYTTLQRWVKNPNLKKYGGQTALTEVEEEYLVQGLLECAKWGFPLQRRDILNIVQCYLNRRGTRLTVFKNNRPGNDWFIDFIKRHKQLTLKFCENIKRVRASVTRETLLEYFQNLKKSLEGVPVSNIINYDETNFCDDPGVAKVVVKRGVKHAERIIDSSKSSTSVMVAACADGHVFPPYIVYKAKHIYAGWTEGGIQGAAYNRSITGWFDAELFEEWFNKILLPYCRRLNGSKVIIGDNLSSHLTMNVIESCLENNIRFVLLPPNSTHICQPLDVAYFRPLKRAWRNILEEWKKKNRGVVPKTVFPKLLKNTFDSIQLTSADNVKAGFKACGIVPFNPEKVLTKVPTSDKNQNEKCWTDSFVDLLKQFRGSDDNKIKKRGKKINVSPGTSILPEDMIQNTDMIEMEDDNDDFACSPAADPISSPMFEKDYEIGESSTAIEDVDRVETQNYNEGDFVVVEFKTNKTSRFFVGKIESTLSDDSFMVNFLRKNVTSKQVWFVYPTVEDVRPIEATMIVNKVFARNMRRNRFIIDLVDSRVE